MSEFKRGDTIRIPCEAMKAPFPNEYLITIATLDGEMEGLVQPAQLTQVGSEWHVLGVVQRVEANSLVARVWGEFIFTAGLINLPLDSVLGAE